jgi:cbb3-type cytochrome oxidase maturation protein
MSVIVILIAFSFLVAGGFLAAFLWAVRSGQYEDRHTPSIRILFDDHPRPSKQNHHTSRHDQQHAA